MSAMLRRFFKLFKSSLYHKGKICCRKQLQVAGLTSLEDLSLNQKNLNVRIIHAGGLVELHPESISASQVLERYSGMHLSRPEIFKNPDEAIVHPHEKLLPGQKFYLVPSTTVRKLRRKHYFMKSREKGAEEVVMKKVKEGENKEDSFCSAKDFFVSRCAMWKSEREVKKPFVPPIRRPGMWRGFGWEPSLPSIEELSP